jgi:hypothetical protein
VDAVVQCSVVLREMRMIPICAWSAWFGNVAAI